MAKIRWELGPYRGEIGKTCARRELETLGKISNAFVGGDCNFLRILNRTEREIER